MLAGMDFFAAIPPVVGAIANLSVLAMNALAERLLAIALAVLIVGGVTVFALTAFAWLWVKHAVAELHHLPASTARF
jgi:hypothetical protein